VAQLRLDPSASGGGLPGQVDIYTDGGCDPNPGPGGWAALIRWGDREWVLSGNDPDTTNNRMELHAAAAALALLHGLPWAARSQDRCRVEMYTDSQYLRQGIAEWMEKWVRDDWHTRAGEPVKNQDLWQALHRLVQAHDVSWHWLKGHAGHPLNERADRLATEALRSLRATATREPSEENRPNIEISVKTSGRGSGGAAGWGAVLRMGEQRKELGGRRAGATANALLIVGATEALQALKKPCQATVVSDAKYLVQGASAWVRGWQDHGWKTQDGKPVANQAEWKALLEAARPHQVTWTLVQGDPFPADLARASELASQAAETGPTVRDRP